MYITKYLHRILLVLELVILTCSCSRVKELPLCITAVPSKPPCWMSLCIGDIADMDLALKLLKNTDGMRRAERTIDAPSFFSFGWQDPRDPNNILRGDLTINEFHINSITLWPNSVHTLGQLIKDFGNPDCVIVTDYDDKRTGLFVKYSEKGLVIYLDSGKGSNLITKQTKIISINLFKPQSEHPSCQSKGQDRAYKWAGIQQTYP
jgi:hypothetical protein